MATTTKIIAIGNSAGIILPKETLARLNVRKGDTVYLNETSAGFRSAPMMKSSAPRWSCRPRHSPLSRCIKKLAE